MGEEQAEEPLTLSAMKSPAFTTDWLLENCDQMVLCTENHTQIGFSIYHQTKRCVVFLDSPQAIFIGKKNGYSAISVRVVNVARYDMLLAFSYDNLIAIWFTQYCHTSKRSL